MARRARTGPDRGPPRLAANRRRRRRRHPRSPRRDRSGSTAATRWGARLRPALRRAASRPGPRRRSSPPPRRPHRPGAASSLAASSRSVASTSVASSPENDLSSTRQPPARITTAHAHTHVLDHIAHLLRRPAGPRSRRCSSSCGEGAMTAQGCRAASGPPRPRRTVTGDASARGRRRGRQARVGWERERLVARGGLYPWRRIDDGGDGLLDGGGYEHAEHRFNGAAAR